MICKIMKIGGGAIPQALKYLKEVEYFERRLGRAMPQCFGWLVSWFLSLPGFMVHSEKPQPTSPDVGHSIA